MATGTHQAERARRWLHGSENVTDDAELRWMVLLDPSWSPAEEGEGPPFEAIVGGWCLDENGDTERFEPNPLYRPIRPDSPTDPVDAAMQGVVRGGTDWFGLLAVLRDIMFGVGIDSAGVAVVAPAPDERPSVLVTTAPAHRPRVNVAGWREVSLAQLAGALPERGVDVLLNPGSRTSMRLDAVAVKAAAHNALTDQSSAVPSTSVDPGTGSEYQTSAEPATSSSSLDPEALTAAESAIQNLANGGLRRRSLGRRSHP